MAFRKQNRVLASSTAGLLVAAGLSGAPLVATSATAASIGDSKAFSYTNGTNVQQYVVADGVTAVKIVATGAGGGGGGNMTTGGQGGVGGSGAKVTTYQAVTGGQVLQVRVGGGGGASGVLDAGRGGGGSATSVQGGAVTVVAGGGGGGGANSTFGGSAQAGTGTGAKGDNSRGGLGGNPSECVGCGGGGTGGAVPGGTTSGAPDGTDSTNSGQGGGGGYYLHGNGGAGQNGVIAGGTTASFGRSALRLGGGGADFGGGAGGTNGGGGGGGGYGGGGGGGTGSGGSQGGGGGAGGSFASPKASGFADTDFAVANNGGATFSTPGSDGSVTITIVGGNPSSKPGKPKNFRELGAPTAKRFVFRWQKSAGATSATRYHLLIQQRGRAKVLIRKVTPSLSAKISRAALLTAWRKSLRTRGDVRALVFRASVFARTGTQRSPAATLIFRVTP